MKEVVLLKRLDMALARIESETDTLRCGEDMAVKAARMIQIAHHARWENHKLLTAFLYEDKTQELKDALRQCLHLLGTSGQYVGSNIFTMDRYERLLEDTD